MIRNMIKFSILGASMGFISACLSTAPDGKGSVDESGKERDPSEILTVGAIAPDFTATDEVGNVVRLADFKDQKNVVLVFYPGNDTPGCTKQLCAIRDDWSAFESADAAVFGVNPANASSHQQFVDKYSFPFPLLADTEGKLVRDYGCRGIGGMTTRTVYVIGKDGTVVYAKRGMPSNTEILAAIPAGG